MPDPKTHQRVNDILLGPLERPALRWFSAHMPAWVSPDTLTSIGVLGAIMIFAGYGLTNLHPAFLWLANLGLLLNWFGDSLDGTLARYRHIERPKYGYFVDHIVDAVSEMLVVLGLGISPYVRFDLASLALIGYMLMSVLVYVRTYVVGVFRISYGKFGPTEMRAILFLANVGIFFAGNPTLALPWGRVSAYDLVVGALAALLYIVFVVSSYRQARELAEEE